jgi:protein gp37
MNQTRIDWADMTWNPVTGCLYGCPYCYAEKQARRYNPRYEEIKAAARYIGIGRNGLYDITEPWDYDGRTLAHPFGFSPTFHRYRLEEPQLKKQPQNIFVCSMADLFGSWVPDEWIDKVFDVCYGAPQHRFLFLTKNPKRFEDFINKPMPDNMWFGFSQTKREYIGFDTHPSWNTFVSIEPLLERLDCATPEGIDWVVIGAETGNRKGKIIPKKEWIEEIVTDSRSRNIPVFMKNSLASIWGEPLIQEYPWEKG